MGLLLVGTTRHVLGLCVTGLGVKGRGGMETLYLEIAVQILCSTN